LLPIIGASNSLARPIYRRRICFPILRTSSFRSRCGIAFGSLQSKESMRIWREEAVCVLNVLDSPSMPAGGDESGRKSFDLGNGSSLLYVENLLDPMQAHAYLERLNKKLPWACPTLSIFGRKCKQVSLGALLMCVCLKFESGNDKLCYEGFFRTRSIYRIACT
jgi:hypothetical protein